MSHNKFTLINNLMRKLIPYLAFACLTGFTATNALPVVAGGCSSHMNKTAEIKCAKDDIECQTKKVTKPNSKDSVNS